MDKTAKKHFDAVQSGKVTKTNIIGIRKLLNAVERSSNGWSISRTCPKASFEAADQIVSEIYRCKPLVTGELHVSGLKLLQNKRYAARLESVKDIITCDWLSFRLIGWQETNGLHHPIYRARNSQGAFNFINIPWQSGGNGPEVLKVG